MSDKIRSNITTSYMLFVFDFADPSSVDKANIEAEIKFPVSELFNSQKKADLAKKVLGKVGFDKVLSVYFSRFHTQDGFNHLGLEQELKKNKKVFLRHLGKDKVNYLNLLISTMEALKEKKRGLLFGEAS